jgi:hypothetical protein
VFSQSTSHVALEMLHVPHGDAFRHQMPQMRVIPASRRVSIDDKLVLLLFELRLYVGR